MSENVVIKKDRTVTVPASEAKIGVQYDHNVNVITFDCPRYPDDDRSVDMSTMQIYINYMLPDKTLGSYLAENVKVDTNNPDTIHFNWKITRNVTQVKGALQALVCIKKVDTEGNELYHWNTDLIQSFHVGEGMECLETISSDYADVISQLLVNMNTVVGEFEALSADVTARTSEETLQGLVNNAASDEKLGSIVNAYMEANPVGINVDDTLTVSGDAADAKITGDRISELKSDLENYTKNIGLYGESYNIVDLTKITNGYYIKPDGSVNSNASYSYTDFIPVTEGDVIVSWKWSGSRWVENIESIRFIAAYDSNKSVISDSGAEKQFEYVVPSGVSYIILSCNTSYLGNKIQMILRNYTQTPSEYITYAQGEYKGKASFISHDMASEIEDISFGKTQYIRRCRGGFIASGDLSEDIVFPNNSVNGRYRIVVNAKITALGTITIGRKHGSTSYGYFEIDGSEIRWYSTGTTLTKTYTHGLTIGKECAIIIETNPSPASAYRQYEHRVTVVSGGQSYATENIVIQNFSKGKTCYIHADNSTLSVDASFTFYNAKSPVYAFGDSYFTWGPARWTGYLYDDGFADNVLTDAYSGRGSKDALESFKNLECIGIPSYVLWCMGMNDADTAESVNSNWQTAYDYVCDYCDNHHIELILATIPEVTNASYRNDMKNSIVRNSGRRYVDFAKAVNAETVGSAWYDGMLASDGVHPTESGARTLYNQILVDFPEIMLFN